MLRVSVLGPLDVRHDGEPVPLGSARQRTLLAALLCRPGATVSADELCANVWRSAATRSNLQVYVHRLRRTLRDPARIAHLPPGYALRIGRDEFDVTRFEDLVARGRKAATAGDPAGAAACFDDALGLWRGEPFAELDGPPLVREEACRLEERRLTVLEWRVHAQLASGHAADLLPELAELTGRYPLREEFHRQYAAALHRAGRPHEARLVRERPARPAGVVPAASVRPGGAGTGLVARARRLAALGDHGRAIVVGREALRAAGDDDVAVSQPAHELLGVCLREQGSYPAAYRHLAVGLTQAVGAGDVAAEARALQMLAIVARERGRFDEAGRLLARAAALHHDLDDATHRACLLLSGGELRLRAGGRAARRDVEDGLDRCRDLGLAFGVAYGLRLLGEIELAERRPGRAVPILRQAVRLSGATASTFMLAAALRGLGRAHAGAGHRADARSAWTRAATAYRTIGNLPAQAEVTALLNG